MFQLKPVNRKPISAIAGALFATGCWIMIDVTASHHRVLSGKQIYYMPGFCNILSFVVIQCVPMKRLVGSDSFEVRGNFGPRIVMFLALMTAFGSIIAAVYILGEVIFYNVIPLYVGFGVFFQNAFILVSSLLWKFCRLYDDGTL